MFISNAYIIAGIAISPLLNISGDEAIAIACAAFCIPTSITMVRRTPAVNLPTRERRELHSIATTIKAVAATPKMLKFSIISFVYCRKNTPANSIRAGKAHFPNILFTFFAASGLK